MPILKRGVLAGLAALTLTTVADVSQSAPALDATTAGPSAQSSSSVQTIDPATITWGGKAGRMVLAGGGVPGRLASINNGQSFDYVVFRIDDTTSIVEAPAQESGAKHAILAVATGGESSTLTIAKHISIRGADGIESRLLLPGNSGDYKISIPSSPAEMGEYLNMGDLQIERVLSDGATVQKMHLYNVQEIQFTGRDGNQLSMRDAVSWAYAGTGEVQKTKTLFDSLWQDMSQSQKCVTTEMYKQKGEIREELGKTIFSKTAFDAKNKAIINRLNKGCGSPS